jgi:hypothetical protein
LRHLTGGDEDTPRWAAFGWQNHNRKPIKYVLIAIADEISALRERARFLPKYAADPFLDTQQQRHWQANC